MTTAQAQAVNIHRLIRDTAKASKASDPDIIAKDVLDQIDEADYRDVLLSLLRPAVRVVFSDQRREGLGEREPDGKPVIRSAKGDGIRALRTLLDATVNVGGSSFKPFGQCNEADLLIATQIMRSMAAAHEKRANTYEQYLTLLRKHKATTVADLPQQVLTASLGLSS